jgi:hypothetical protein
MSRCFLEMDGDDIGARLLVDRALEHMRCVIAPVAAAPTAASSDVHTLAAAAATPTTAAARSRSRLPKCKSTEISFRFMMALLKRMPPTEP